MTITSLEPLVDAWLIAQESPHTQRAYRCDLVSEAARQKVPGWIPWCTGRGLDPLAARRQHVDAYKQALKAGGYSPTTVARKLAAISSWYTYLLEEEAIDDNPAKIVKRPRVDRTVSDAVGLTEDELNALFDEATTDSARSLALVSVLFFGGGLRVGSTCGANVGDLGWSDGKRTIKLRVKGGEIVREHLDEMAANAVDAYLTGRGQTGKDDPLFTTNLGNRLDPAFVAREVRRLCKSAGVRAWKDVTPHSLRHTFATLALDAGASLVDLQDQMRHRSLDTTRRYDRARGKRDRQPSRLLADRRRQYLAQQANSASATALPRHD